MNSEEVFLALGLNRAAAKSDIESLCRKHGAAFVIDTAMAYAKHMERQAADAHRRELDALYAAFEASDREGERHELMPHQCRRLCKQPGRMTRRERND